MICFYYHFNSSTCPYLHTIMVINPTCWSQLVAAPGPQRAVLKKLCGDCTNIHHSMHAVELQLHCHSSPSLMLGGSSWLLNQHHPSSSSSSVVWVCNFSVFSYVHAPCFLSHCIETRLRTCTFVNNSLSGLIITDRCRPVEFVDYEEGQQESCICWLCCEWIILSSQANRLAGRCMHGIVYSSRAILQDG